MAQFDEYRNFCGKVVFRAVGVGAFLLFLLWNPLVLRPRLWNTSVVAHSMAIDAALLAIGIGLFGLRRWAAILSSALTGYVAFPYLLSSTAGTQVFPILIVLVPSVLTVVFWQALAWGNKLREPFLVLVIVLVDALIHYAAFVIRGT